MFIKLGQKIIQMVPVVELLIPAVLLLAGIFADDCLHDVVLYPGNAPCSGGTFQRNLYDRRNIECVTGTNSSSNVNHTWHIVGGIDLRRPMRGPFEYYYQETGIYETFSYISYYIRSKGIATFECCSTLNDTDKNDSCDQKVCVSCRLDVLYLVEFTVTQTPENPVVEGDDISLTCNADANPRFDGYIEWRHGYSQESLSRLRQPSYSEDNDTLIISEITRHQSGWYQCAGNSLWYPGYDPYWSPRLSEKVQVIVHFSPNVSYVNKRTWIGANENYTAALECKVSSNPTPTVKWYNPNNEVVSNETNGRITQEDTISGNEGDGYSTISRLTFHIVITSSDYGVYSCNASNGIGVPGEIQIRLRETGKPLPPRDLRVTQTTENSIALEWTPGYDGGENQKFFGFVRDKHGLSSTRYLGTSRTGVMEALLTFTAYEVSVYSQNRNGRSEAVVTDAMTVPNPPDIIGIRFNYDYWQSRFSVQGIPPDDDPDTCVKLEAFKRRDDSLVVLSGFGCVQNDGVFYFSDINIYYGFQARYCRAQICSRYSSGVPADLATVTSTTAPPPKDGVSLWVIILVCVLLATVLLVFIVVCYRQGYSRSLGQSFSVSTHPNSTCHASPDYEDSPPSYDEVVGNTAI